MENSEKESIQKNATTSTTKALVVPEKFLRKIRTTLGDEMSSQEVTDKMIRDYLEVSEYDFKFSWYRFI